MCRTYLGMKTYRQAQISKPTRRCAQQKRTPRHWKPTPHMRGLARALELRELLVSVVSVTIRVAITKMHCSWALRCRSVAISVRSPMRGARAEALAAVAEAARLRLRLIADQRAASVRLSIAERALVDAEMRQSALREALMLTERGRTEGEIGYIEYLRARQALFDADRDLGAARIAKSAAISNLNQAMGVLP
ncbi:MAG: hypothetical protein C0510_13145 [Erythrobacter sp.]|nr:hypothetical protein [Erythrobacter sp.]